MFDLYEVALPTIFLVGLAVIFAASEIGWQFGIRASGHSARNVSTLESAMLGLLALMIGFTFAMALSRFDARRNAVLNEANSIETAALRARLLPEPHRTQALKTLQKYVTVRLEIVDSNAPYSELKAIVDRSNALQETLWHQAMALAQEDKSQVPTGLFIQSLNDVIDNQGKRLAALRNTVPNIVVLMLFGVAALASAFAGYASGLDERHKRLPVYLMGLLVSAVILLILDLDRPTTGFVQVSQQPMIDAAAHITSFLD
jgi:hypothetical protein